MAHALDPVGAGLPAKVAPAEVIFAGKPAYMDASRFGK